MMTTLTIKMTCKDNLRRLGDVDSFFTIILVSTCDYHILVMLVKGKIDSFEAYAQSLEQGYRKKFCTFFIPH